MASETTGQISAAAPGGAKPLPVAMEIPVTVNGASTVAGSDTRQPFSEATQTVLVFGSGAVIRLAAAVGPGQLLFVTNEKSKQEVVCQVVKTKQNGGGAGYVELKFTEVAVDFWGIRGSGNGVALPATAAPSVAAPSAVGTVEPPAKAPEAKPSPIAPPVSPPPAGEIPLKAVPATPPAVLPPAPAAPVNAAAPVVPAPPPAQKVPTLSEFLTHGSNGLELKARERGQTEKSETPNAAVQTEERLAFANRPTPPAPEPEAKRSLSAALGVGPNPAPGSASFDLSA